MYSILFSIIVLLVLIYDCLEFYIISGKHHKEILKRKDSLGLTHNHEHVAGVVLMLFASSMMLVGLVLLLLQHYYFSQSVDEILINFLAGVFGVFVISNIWYVRHLKKEEKGVFDDKTKTGL